jgi:hypothetical protein
MVNYRIEDLEHLLNELRNEGVTVVDEIEKYESGKLGWILARRGIKQSSGKQSMLHCSKN